MFVKKKLFLFLLMLGCSQSSSNKPTSNNEIKFRFSGIEYFVEASRDNSSLGWNSITGSLKIIVFFDSNKTSNNFIQIVADNYSEYPFLNSCSFNSKLPIILTGNGYGEGDFSAHLNDSTTYTNYWNIFYFLFEDDLTNCSSLKEESQFFYFKESSLLVIKNSKKEYKLNTNYF